MNKKITIIGLGNPILKDDGVGHRVIEELEKETMPDGVVAVKAGGNFYDYWDALTQSKHIIVVDALIGGGDPGSVYLLRPDEIVREKPSGLFQHEDDFLSVLNFLHHQGVKPEVMIVGIEPKEINYSLDLSTVICKKIPEIVKIVRGLCADIFEGINMMPV